MQRDARNCDSPNSGYTMATAAGALDIQLIKKDTYVLGDNTHEISVLDISKAIRLTSTTIRLFTIFILIILTVIFLIIWKQHPICVHCCWYILRKYYYFYNNFKIELFKI